MSGAELRGLVGWTVQQAPPGARAGRVVGAVPGTGSRRARQAGAPWRPDVTDGTGTGTLGGAWLGLLWIGRRAGRPEPAGPGQRT